MFSFIQSTQQLLLWNLRALVAYLILSAMNLTNTIKGIDYDRKPGSMINTKVLREHLKSDDF